MPVLANPKQQFTWLHIYLWAFVILNFIVQHYSGFGFKATIIFCAKVAICLTGFILFFYSIRPFKKRAMYFAAYVFSPVIVFFSWLADGVFGATLASLLMFFIYPEEVKYKKNNVIVYGSFQGFMASCCTYEIREEKYLFFEKYTGEIKAEDSDIFAKIDVIIQNNTVTILYSGTNINDIVIIKAAHDIDITVKLKVPNKP